MGFQRLAFEFRVELDGNKPWMIGQFDDLDQASIGAGSGEADAIRFELLSILIVELVAMPMSLVDQICVVRFAGNAVAVQFRGLAS